MSESTIKWKVNVTPVYAVGPRLAGGEFPTFDAPREDTGHEGRIPFVGDAWDTEEAAHDAAMAWARDHEPEVEICYSRVLGHDVFECVTFYQLEVEPFEMDEDGEHDCFGTAEEISTMDLHGGERRYERIYAGCSEWEGPGWYEIKWSDGGQDFTNDGAVWFDRIDDYLEDMLAAHECETDTHMAYAEWRGCGDTPGQD